MVKKTSKQSKEYHYLGVFIALLFALLVFGFYSPVGFTGGITGGQIVDVSSTHSSLNPLLFLSLLVGVLLFFFTRRMMSRVL